MQIDFKKKFCKDYAKSPEEIRSSFRKRLSLFRINKYDKLLNNHQLSGDSSFLRSINVTGDWRALFVDNNDSIIFVALDKHSNLYK